ncbi:MAG: PAS domain-containing protein [Pseudomonadota bacterium]
MAQRLTYAAPAILTAQPLVRLDETTLDVVAPCLPAAWQCNLADDSLTWDAGVFDLFGLARDTRLERPATVAMYTDHSRAMLDRLRSHAIATGGSFTFEAQIVRPSGEKRWMRVSADTVVTGGRVTHLYGTKQDIIDEPAVQA